MSSNPSWTPTSSIIAQWHSDSVGLLNLSHVEVAEAKTALQGPSAEEIRAWAARREQFLSTAFRFCVISEHNSGGAACPACVEYTEACNALLRVTHGLRNMYLGMNWVVRQPKLRPQRNDSTRFVQALELNLSKIFHISLMVDNSLVEIKGSLRGAQQDLLDLINIRRGYDEAKVCQEVVQALLDHIGEERQILYEVANISSAASK